MEEVFSNLKRLKQKELQFYKISIKVLSSVCVVLIGCILIIIVIHHLDRPVIYCKLDKCIRSAAYLKLSMNLNADPCEDFFQYTCGNWSREHPLIPPHKKNSKFVDTSRRIIIAAHDFLSAADGENDILPVKQSRMFYRSCLDEERMKSIGYTTIFEYLRKLNLPLVPTLFVNKSNDDYMFDWKRTEAKMKSVLKLDALIALRVIRNPYNTTENLLYIGQPAYTCPRIRKERGKNNEILKYVVEQIIKDATSRTLSEEDLSEAISITNKIQGVICSSGINTSSASSSYRTPYKVEYLQREIDDHMTRTINRTEPQFLQKYIGLVFDGIDGVTLDFQQDLIYIKGTNNKNYLLNILIFLYSTPEIQIEFYLWWFVVRFLGKYSHLGQFIRHIMNPHHGRMRSPSKRTLELICANDVSYYMPYAVAYGIAGERFQTVTGNKIKMMVRQMKEELKDRIRAADWLDERTRALNLEKLEYMTSFVGIPDWLFNKGQLEQFYKNVEINESNFLRNTLQITELIAIKHYQSYKNGKSNMTEFPKNPFVVNAYALFPINAIVVPLAILTFPMYDFGLDVLNYGFIGPILGHELIHGFDTKGMKFDKHGNYGDWWSEKSETIYQRKISCFIEQYDNLTVKGVKGHVSGLRTRNENIADNSGLIIAFEAFRKNEIMVQSEKLPGFESFTSAQMFFIAFGSIWCQTSCHKQQEESFKRDPHSPGPVRVNVAMQNSVHFAEAFNCPLGSSMNPTHKCKLW